MEKECEIDEKELGWKPSFSIAVGVGWLIFIIVWLAFYASNYAWEKSFAIILISILALFLLLGGTWCMFGIRRIPAKEKEKFKTEGFKWRMYLSMILPFACLIFLIVWFWSYAEPYTIWQNIAVILVTLLVIGGVLGGVWARWGIKHGKKFED
jgi:peptidoglycan/LPS O-acetylase OafA/YrhL